ncbi:hypothetical protein [Legionella hackeliae]|uniref:Uncharacterized protein n=1 Tax=Legionella hackeliae TaxID=449 RepID=A0A0A8UNL8_LEGHA|nr:hypothetical protein [Legionella hackeliae]KTD08927.1 hypothetical protein Lhac_3150 [Legionella hackeliae]CEK10358.1 protein of unknown function [Legionella hackeliae]STX47093.1 Uncharacterised protein [Legionella hackeliae]
MTKVIKPIWSREEDIFKSTKQHFLTMFQPVQETKRKESDVAAYFLSPVVDTLVIPALLLDTAIHLMNALITLLKAGRDWASEQTVNHKLLPNSTKRDLEQSLDYFLEAVASFVEVINPIFSVISLVTRPFASAIQGISNACEKCASSAENHDDNYVVGYSKQ